MFDERKFKAQLVLKGMSMKQLAKALNINESTLYRKIQQNGAFTREEINRIIDLLGIEHPEEIFFAQKLA